MASGYGTHSLSPSSWNNFEACPRKFWLSRQRLPRKTGMAAALGTAVHDSVEDLCNLDLEGRDDNETGWLPSMAKAILTRQWEDEREKFFKTPRHPKWKEDEFPGAQKQLIGALNILFKKAGYKQVSLSSITIAQWKDIQEMVLAAEGTLRSSCGRLMGRLDLLVADRDEEGNTIGWIVADLKTGKPPDDEVYDTVSRQLRLYRDLLIDNNPNHPKITAEGWYSKNSSVYVAEGPNVIDDALVAWEASQLTKEPFVATPNSKACGFCEWKAWCPEWPMAKARGELESHGTFRDYVVKIIKLEDDCSVGLVEIMRPLDELGNMVSTDQKYGVIFSGYAQDHIRKISDLDWQGPVFLGGVNVSGSSWKMGDWCDVLPWEPLLESKRDFN
ncbi:MAG: hypothetical protein CMO20_03465 [Thermoplasmata archaeon]|nr:hypothetical protein [Thermoplasmata archaeon]